MNNEWIPCAKQLPDSEGAYVVYFGEVKIVGIMHFSKVRGFFSLIHDALIPPNIPVSRVYKASLPDVIQRIALDEVGGYSIISKFTETIPNERRVRRGYSGSVSETVLVLCNARNCI